MTVVSEYAWMRFIALRNIIGFGVPTKYGSEPVALVISAATFEARHHDRLRHGRSDERPWLGITDVECLGPSSQIRLERRRQVEHAVSGNLIRQVAA